MEGEYQSRGQGYCPRGENCWDPRKSWTITMVDKDSYVTEQLQWFIRILMYYLMSINNSCKLNKKHIILWNKISIYYSFSKLSVSLFSLLSSLFSLISYFSVISFLFLCFSFFLTNSFSPSKTFSPSLSKNSSLFH